MWHFGHDDGAPQLQLPPVPSQHVIPNALHCCMQPTSQLHGSEGRVEFPVFGGTGIGAALGTIGNWASAAMPHMPDGATFRAISTYPDMHGARMHAVRVGETGK